MAQLFNHYLFKHQSFKNYKLETKEEALAQEQAVAQIINLKVYPMLNF